MRYLSSVPAGLAALSLSVATGQYVEAQVTRLTVRGSVFDSLRGKPLERAFITMGGNERAVETGPDGRFEFDSIAPGVYTVTAQHPLFDSIGLSGIAVSASIRTGTREIKLAVPSFETLWRTTCRGNAPKDSGIVFGTVRHASTGSPIADVSVELSWVEVVLNGTKHIVERHWSVDTRTNETGGYAFCGIPRETNIRLSAHNDSSASGSIEIPPTPLRIGRRNLLIGTSSNRAPRGAIAGTVVDTGGAPIVGARVLVRDGREVRTDADGRFLIPDTPTGTRQVDVIAIGLAPSSEIVDVPAGGTASVVVKVQRMLELDTVHSKAARGNRVLASEFTIRRKLGFGYSRDSTDIAKYSHFVDALGTIPSLNVRTGSSSISMTVPDGHGATCTPEVFIDGVSASIAHIIDLFPNEVAGVEVYPRPGEIPQRFVRPGIRPRCGAVLVWTMYGFRNR